MRRDLDAWDGTFTDVVPVTVKNGTLVVNAEPAAADKTSAYAPATLRHHTTNTQGHWIDLKDDLTSSRFALSNQYMASLTTAHSGPSALEALVAEKKTLKELRGAITESRNEILQSDDMKTSPFAETIKTAFDHLGKVRKQAEAGYSAVDAQGIKARKNSMDGALNFNVHAKAAADYREKLWKEHEAARAKIEKDFAERQEAVEKEYAEGLKRHARLDNSPEQHSALLARAGKLGVLGDEKLDTLKEQDKLFKQQNDGVPALLKQHSASLDRVAGAFDRLRKINDPNSQSTIPVLTDAVDDGLMQAVPADDLNLHGQRRAAPARKKRTLNTGKLKTRALDIGAGLIGAGAGFATKAVAAKVGFVAAAAAATSPVVAAAGIGIAAVAVTSIVGEFISSKRQNRDFSWKKALFNGTALKRMLIGAATAGVGAYVADAWHAAHESPAHHPHGTGTVERTEVGAAVVEDKVRHVARHVRSGYAELSTKDAIAASVGASDDPLGAFVAKIDPDRLPQGVASPAALPLPSQAEIAERVKAMDLRSAERLAASTHSGASASVDSLAQRPLSLDSSLARKFTPTMA